ncbi:MAG: baseplate assembly protein [Alphaproteobacteria bacterium]|nr:baseplate assembly protein [Alphaproteobacteria bacterium]MBV9373193.1 baseplate assembly protein [Alphaproteobacteria bacterium]MBV9900282.1 baseplate assembly protein [Alphaproteobacteria bacterium]
MVEEYLERLTEIVASRYFGKFRGRVVDNQDPQKRGRLQVQVPAIMADQAIWALPCVPMANPDGSGFFSIPDVEANVWVEFEAGNLDFPIWVGCFWADDAVAAADAVPAVKFWRTKSFVLRIDDDAGELTIEKTDGGGKLTISASEVAAEASSVLQTAGARKTKLSQASFDVLDGALTVV